MRVSENLAIIVQRDLDIDKLLIDAKISHGLGLNILRRWGGHRLAFREEFYNPDELLKKFVPEATPLTFDYHVHMSSNGRDPFPDHDDFAREAITQTQAVLVFPEEGWNARELLKWMSERGLRTASFYEHVAICHKHRDEIGERIVIPFAGFTNPMRHLGECTGLFLLRGNEGWWSEGRSYIRYERPILAVWGKKVVIVTPGCQDIITLI